MNWLERRWYQAKPPIYLRPLSALFGKLAAHRRKTYHKDPEKVWQAPVPVIVVGNITVGGTGKTPLVIYLVNLLQQQGYKVGVISRGYGGKADIYPLEVIPETPVTHCGDEPKLIKLRCQCPVVVGPERKLAAEYLLEHHDCDVIISDDGLQHYALARDIEIAVIDAKRGLGNGSLLPAGPLREPAERLDECDFIIENTAAEADDASLHPKAHRLTLKSDGLYPINALAAKEPVPERSLRENKKVLAFAGIGNPQRFFDQLAHDFHVSVEGFPLPDHYDYSQGQPIPQTKLKSYEFRTETICTEKDAVKLQKEVSSMDYPVLYLKVSAQLPTEFDEALLRKLSEMTPLANETANETANGSDSSDTVV